MRKKVAVLGGGSGLSYLLNGLKQYPLDITAIVSVCDNGSSTGILREEFNIPAVGDIRKVLVSLSETEPLVEQLFNYRFKTTSDLNGHAVGNLLLTAVEEMTGSLSEGIEALSKILNLKGKVVPLTEDNVTLMGEMMDGTIIEGEEQLTKDRRTIKKVYYKEKATPTKEAIDAIINADLIILSMGSLFTSIIPNLICDDIVDAMFKSQAKILYTCNIVTQPGETDGFTVTDHVKMLNKYLKKRKVDIVIANNGYIDASMADKYKTLEQKDPVIFDSENFKNYDMQVIGDDLVTIYNNMIRHNSLKLGFHIFFYAMNN